MKRCPRGFHRIQGKCQPKGNVLKSTEIFREVKGFTQAYNRGDYDEAKRYRMKIERKAGKGSMPAYPDQSELQCPMKLAREVTCASNMIRSGRAKGYQANAVCRSSLKRTQCQICPTLPACRTKR